MLWPQDVLELACLLLQFALGCDCQDYAVQGCLQLSVSCVKSIVLAHYVQPACLRTQRMHALVLSCPRVCQAWVMT